MIFSNRTVRTYRPGKTLIAVLCMCLWSASPVWAGSSIKQDMKDMKAAYSAAMESTTVPEFSGHFNTLKASARMAGASPYSPDQMTYDKGMRELQGYFVQIDAALKANDLGAAKKGLGEINQARRHYHQLLD